SVARYVTRVGVFLPSFCKVNRVIQVWEERVLMSLSFIEGSQPRQSASCAVNLPVRGALDWFKSLWEWQTSLKEL
ncbi:hypothetical protein, partial [Sansalvadorimonas verongulae]|uniref:hypothetical protein n=1 Tax=Sansalvadorimonas verongulae TaxID=2172824 RepID=UPI001E514895